MWAAHLPIVVAIATFLQPVALKWVNQYDEVLKFECPIGEHLSRLESQHNNRKEDRVWSFECRKGFVTDKCTWSGYQNAFDQDLNFKCPDDGLIAGLTSYHSNAQEDRRWQFKCCSLASTPGKNCATTNNINSWDNYMDYTVETGSAIRGFESYHHNHYEDRLWKVHHCEYTNCRAKGVRVLEALEPQVTGSKIVGIATSQGCSPGSTYTTTLHQQKGMEETYSIQDTAEHPFTISEPLSVGFTVGKSFFQEAFSYMVGLEKGGSYSNSITHEMSRSVVAGSSQELEYQGPGAALIIADCEEHKIRRDQVEVEYDVECDDGYKFKKLSKVSFSAQTYGHTHYIQKLVTFEGNGCTPETEKCIDDVTNRNEFSPYDIIRDFEKCFHNSTSLTLN